MSARGRNVILTGVPRSGTTLTCHLLNQLPDTLALHEPMQVSVFPTLANREAICEAIARFFEQTRQSVHAAGTVTTKLVDGRLPVNPMADEYSAHGLRRARAAQGEFQLEKGLAADFLLIIKHPAAFTALLEDLVGRFPCYAVIRNPLSVLASWNSIDVPVRTGHAPAAEGLDPQLAQALAQIKDTLARQIHLLAWFYEKYHRLLPQNAILRYEDTVASGGKTLQVITPRAKDLNEKLDSKNVNQLYDKALMRRLGEKLLQTDGAMWRFYTRDSVERLLNS